MNLKKFCKEYQYFLLLIIMFIIQIICCVIEFFIPLKLRFKTSSLIVFWINGFILGSLLVLVLYNNYLTK